MAKAKTEIGQCMPVWSNPHQHTQDLWLGRDLVRELKGCPSWIAVPTGEHERLNGAKTGLHVASAFLGMGVNWIWSMPDSSPRWYSQASERVSDRLG